ncbi:uncharacterized protein LOC129289265 [Prosopis cineraria]|uniref:uncharacterized protein LOC129289265 n=1 Tax=Prosopis cineraria TaxID=364024 RepID=UPI00240F15D9|nr:uncharacterized protein LOC129289265 [Prosopis cineraria]
MAPKRKESIKDNLCWTSEMDEKFINALLEETMKGNSPDGTFSTFAYDNMFLSLALTRFHCLRRPFVSHCRPFKLLSPSISAASLAVTFAVTIARNFRRCRTTIRLLPRIWFFFFHCLVGVALNGWFCVVAFSSYFDFSFCPEGDESDKMGFVTTTSFV